MDRTTFILLYVEDPAKSAEFYRVALGMEPLEQSPTFAMFKLNQQTMLGLWIRSGVEPAAGDSRAEIAFSLPADSEVDAEQARLKANGAMELLAARHLDFGYSSVVADADGHRLRLFHPG